MSAVATRPAGVAKVATATPGHNRTQKIDDSRCKFSLVKAKIKKMDFPVHTREVWAGVATATSATPGSGQNGQAATPVATTAAINAKGRVA